MSFHNTVQHSSAGILARHIIAVLQRSCAAMIDSLTDPQMVRLARHQASNAASQADRTGYGDSGTGGAAVEGSCLLATIP